MNHYNLPGGIRGWLFTLMGMGVILMALASLHASEVSAQTENNVVYLPIVQRGLPPYVVIGWNDLGMHCYDRDYSTLAVLPPYNNLWAQVIRRGNPPEIVTSGVTVEYSFPDNADSASKTNFWDYEDRLFGGELTPNVGLRGKGLSGTMDLSGDHFVAEGIPITEFSDSNPTVPNYLQLANLVVKDLTGQVLTSSGARVVAPVSSEMRCDTCHNSPSPTNFRMNILLKHDEEEQTVLAVQAASGNPILCARCHADPALGMPGNPSLPSLSAAMHGKHAEETSDCYACHPGPSTRCLRDVMSTQYGITCVNCHLGGMQALGNENRTPWRDEPRCGSCHEARYAENPNTLFRLSKGHGGLYCESCHTSTHAILPSREPQDNLQAIALQGYADTIQECTVCHFTDPGSGGPHHEQ